MDQAVLLEEQKCIIRRYVEVWRRFRRLPDRQSGFVDLEDDMNKGSGMLLCGLLIEAQASSVITADVKDPKFHTAIFGGNDDAAPDMTTEELRQARRYIIHGEGSSPIRWWRANPPFPSQDSAPLSISPDC
jgi:hypothetical protein